MPFNRELSIRKVGISNIHREISAHPGPARKKVGVDVSVYYTLCPSPLRLHSSALRNMAPEQKKRKLKSMLIKISDDDLYSNRPALPFIATFAAGAIAGVSEILTFYPLGGIIHFLVFHGTATH